MSLHHALLGDVAQYLGLGTELAAIAVKHDISKVIWAGRTNVPLVDMHWVALQYYRKICEYAGLRDSATSVEERITFKDGLWDFGIDDHRFLIVEDECCNAFETLRQFSSRGQRQTFVNVISPDYLLRDYMADNVQVMLSDLRAVPHIVPDYAATLRNVALSLFAQLAAGDVTEADMAHEFSLAGLDGNNIAATLMRLAARYLDLGGSEMAGAVVRPEDLPGSVVRTRRNSRIDATKLCYVDETVYRLNPESAIAERCRKILAHSYYVCEDEEEGGNQLGSCLYYLVWQNMLPGQFVTLEGKYYEVLGIDVDADSEGRAVDQPQVTQDSHEDDDADEAPEQSGSSETQTDAVSGRSRVMLRRAADHFDARRVYRQRRCVWVDPGHWVVSHRHNRTRDYAGLHVEVAEALFEVRTLGYYEMTDRGDFAHARYVSVEGVPTRIYHNKEALMLRLAGADDDVLATVTVLLGDLLRTVYPENAAYLLVGSVAANESDFPEGSYDRLAEAEALDPEVIYLFEDSEVDLGLIASIDRNLPRLFGLLQDYLCWHEERLTRSDEVRTNDLPASVPVPQMPDCKPSLWECVKARLFGPRGTRGPAVEMPMPSASGASETTDGDGITSNAGQDECGTRRRGRISAPDFETGGWATASESEAEAPQPADAGNAYARGNYLMFGGLSYPRSLAVRKTAQLLGEMSFANADLKQARAGKIDLYDDWDTDNPSAHRCDFCGRSLRGGEYDVLGDGRERCLACSQQTAGSLRELKELYEDFRYQFASPYGIVIKSGINVAMVSAREICWLEALACGGSGDVRGLAEGNPGVLREACGKGRHVRDSVRKSAALEGCRLAHIPLKRHAIARQATESPRTSPSLSHLLEARCRTKSRTSPPLPLEDRQEREGRSTAESGCSPRREAGDAGCSRAFPYSAWTASAISRT